ncbi:Hypothetical protein NGAL_HAMBI2605_59240 [Neorhizobium galegae bv. orientalis]|nr:Hypothetical protein NGAL_HAMBI2605_59240 [Neorhizobium galegae bv. orientalis]
MRAIDRTTRLFVASLKEAVPDASVSVERSHSAGGRSNYIHIRDQAGRRYWKVRISDHSVGMRRALSGREDAYITAGSGPASWAVWIGEFRKEITLADSEAPRIFRA